MGLVTQRSRVRSIEVILAAGLLLVSAACAGSRPVATGEQKLRFAAVPIGQPEARAKELAGLAGYLEKRLGMPVEVSVGSSYQDTAKGLAAGTWDLILLGPVLYSRAHELGYSAVAMPVRGGKTVHSGLLVARAGGTIASAADLRGRKIAFVDPNSSAGFQYAFAWLYANGLRPGDYERSFHGTHRAVLEAVLRGTHDAGACYGDALHEALSDAERDGIVVIGRTDPVPSDVLAARRDSPHYENVRRALLELNDDPSVHDALAPLHAEKLSAPDEKLFDSARKIDLLVSEESGL